MNKKVNDYKIIQNSKNTLGEGLYLCEQGIYWLDIVQSMLFEKLDDGGFREYYLPEQASAIWKVVEGIVYLASESGIYTFTLSTSEWSVYANIPHQDLSTEMRANDGVAINKDIYFFGTMEKKPSGLNGGLYVVLGQKILKVFDGIGIPNSFIRLDEHSFLVSDSFTGIIYTFTFNPKFNRIVKHEVWLDLSRADFSPDGGCRDDKGNVYIAMWDGGCINKYDSNAKLLSSFKLPAPRPTNCKLSMDSKKLIVTSAREGLSEIELKHSPASGALFQIGLLEL